MKKTLFAFLAVALLLAVAAPAFAQPVLTLKGGVNIATLSGDDVEDLESRTGLNVGASLLLPFTDVVGLEIGAAYSQKGAEEEELGVTGSFEFDYLEFPVLLRFGIPTESALSAHFLVGGALAFETGCQVSLTEGGASFSGDCEEADIETKSMDFGLVGGAGLDIELTESITLVLDALYNLGLTNLDDSADPDDVKSRAFTLQAGLGFPLG